MSTFLRFLLYFLQFLESGSGHIESAVTPNIPVVSELYAIDLTRTSFFYIPSLSYTFRVSIVFVIS